MRPFNLDELLLTKARSRHNDNQNYSRNSPIMTKTLLIMRHAKSSWSHSGLSDHERPLNKRGLHDAPRMAEWICNKSLVPDIVLSSTAKRARTTAELFVENCEGINCGVQTTKEFYHAPARVYLETAVQFPEPVGTAMVVGHNPGMENLVEVLSNEYERMPTAAIACFEFNIQSWEELAPEKATFIDVWRPKEI